MELLGTLIAAILTLMVFSYILGDNVLFRLAAHIFVGTAVGYAIVIISYQVFYPALITGTLIDTAPAVLLCLFLIFKIRPDQSGLTGGLGNISLAFVLGVGAALAIGGGLLGTLLPQISATGSISLSPAHYESTESQSGLVGWLNNIIILLGTVGTLFYFTFAVRAQGVLGGLREAIVRFCAGMGRLIIIFTLGALFASTVSSRVALLISRLQFLADIPRLLGG